MIYHQSLRAVLQTFLLRTMTECIATSYSDAFIFWPHTLNCETPLRSEDLRRERFTQLRNEALQKGHDNRDSSAGRPSCTRDLVGRDVAGEPRTCEE